MAGTRIGPARSCCDADVSLSGEFSELACIKAANEGIVFGIANGVFRKGFGLACH